MSTNVSVPEKIYATELYGNHLMDLSELLLFQCLMFFESARVAVSDSY